MGDLTEQFVDRLKELRHQKGYTQEELARRADVHRTTIDKIESGSRGVSLDTLEKIADALGIEPWKLLRESDDSE